MADIPAARRALLDTGAVEAATLTECLAVDFAVLLGTVCPGIGTAAVETLRQAAGQGITRRMALAARLIAAAGDGAGPGAADALSRHPSDTVRGWACYLIAAAPDLTPEARLAALRPLADDRHFGVREWAWLAVRADTVADPDRAVRLLAGWTTDPSERIRRFASEATRPRGVWCAHSALLRRDPGRGLPVLEPLRADPARYVQDSVGNWLNDAAKDRPDWVRALAARWEAESPVAATRRICRRGLRSLKGV